MAHARLVFDDGCVANLSASRVSYSAIRRIQTFSAAGFTQIDLATRSATTIDRGDPARLQEITAEPLSADERKRIQASFFDDVLPRAEFPAVGGNAIAAEQTDFAQSIRLGRTPRVDGRQGRAALSVAHRILESIAAHRWEGHSDGPIGPHFLPNDAILKSPHWPTSDPSRRQAG
jgi:predicted dehydrogenase